MCGSFFMPKFLRNLPLWYNFMVVISCVDNRDTKIKFKILCQRKVITESGGLLILRRILSMANKNANLHKAKDAKNDEFYTQLTDVAKELMHYKAHFKDKIVLCNCDDPTWSAFWKYFHLNFAELGLKKLISTHYDREEATYKMEYTGGDDNDIEVGVKTPLEGNGDFRNKECLDLLDECDIVVTNPPFSLFREYVAMLMEHEKKFLIIGNKNAITYKEFFPLLKDNKVWIGGTNVKEFLQPDGSIKKFGNIGWFTNLDVAKRHEKLILWKKYTPEEYPKYDNYDAINVDKVSEIPCNYDGVMGVPITFLDSYNPEQFEILGYTAKDMGVDCIKFYENLEQSLEGKPFERNMKSARFSPMIVYEEKPSKTCYRASNVDGYMLKTYGRILIRKKDET